MKLPNQKKDLKRYYSSLRFADSVGMKNWGFTSQDYIKGNKCGIEFAQLNCKKLYIWGEVDTPKDTQEFIKKYNLPNRLYAKIGHWHMIENSLVFYNDLNELLLES